MRDVLDRLVGWWNAGDTVGLATVVATFRSAPRAPGAAMLVGPGGEAVGSVSGGCVEGAVYETAQQVVETGTPALERYGVSDEDAFAVGLTCGGIIDVFVESVDRHRFPELGGVADDIEAGRPVAVATVIEHPDPRRVGRRLVVRPDDDAPRNASTDGGGLGSERADAAVADDARGLLASGRSDTLTYGPDGQRRGEGMRVFCASYAPRPRMLVFGAIDFAAAVARIGSFLGYRVTVCDARPVFATATRFPDADEVVVQWPHRYLREQADAGLVDGRSVVCVLTHDPKFDVPLLEVALRLPEVGYVGAMGSRRTHDDRLARLRDAGLTDAELARLASPIGLDLGARTPEETAVSIAAEIIAIRWGGAGQRLGEVGGPIHHPRHADHAVPSNLGGLSSLNDAPVDVARAQLYACCNAKTWVEGMLAARPYPDLDSLVAESDHQMATLDAAGVSEALAGHARLGQDDGDARSQREQAGVAASDEAARKALLEAADAYERRFGHIFLAAAAGRSAEELAELAEQRMRHDEATELEVVKAELAAIAAQRLSGLVGA